METETNLSGHDWAILVVDNGSSDGTTDAISRQRRVKVVSLAENEGVPARNFGLAHAHGKYVAFLGDDIRLFRKIDRRRKILSFLAASL